MKVIDLGKRILFANDIQYIYTEEKTGEYHNYANYCIVTKVGRFEVDKYQYEKVKEYLLSLNDAPKEDKLNYKDLLQQEIDNENKILLSRLESDTKLDMIKKYITSEEVIDNFKSIESRDEWLKVHDKILDIIDNFKLQNESGEIIEDTPKENKKIEKLRAYEEPFLKNGKVDTRFLLIIDQLNETIDKINGGSEENENRRLCKN